MVNKAVEEMVRGSHGDEMWERIKAKAGVNVEVFVSNEGYPDEITYNLVQAAGETLDMSVEEVLIHFGEHWILHTARENYPGLMNTAGRTLGQFLENLPVFHSRVAMIYPDLRPPRFKCSEITDDSLKLHYFSDRPGLTAFVTGLLRGLSRMFGVDAKTSLTESRAGGAEHDVFQVTWKSAD